MVQISSRQGEPAQIEPLPKVPTGIGGLDEVLFGGLPRGRTTLIRGGPGTGKTVFGLEFLYRRALSGKPGVFVTCEEKIDSLRQNARAFGWDLQALEAEGKLALIQAEPPADLILNGEFSIDGLLAIVGGHLQELSAQYVVIDAIDVLLRLFDDPIRQQAQLYALHHWLLHQQATAILTLKEPVEVSNTYHILDYMVDCVLHLDQRIVGQIATRRLRVLKFRGSGFLSNEHPFIISANGIKLMPVSGRDLDHQPLGPPVPTGVSGLDALLSGGFRRGSCVLVAGATGTGKTTLVSSFARAASARQERVLYVSYEEAQESLFNMMQSSGIDLRSALNSERLQLIAALPESRGTEEHLLHIFEAIDTFQPEHLIVDAISAIHRMGSEQAMLDFLMRLTTRCRERGITSLYTNQITSFSPVEKFSDFGISSFVDTLILVEQLWTQDAHERRLLIVKARGSKHSHTFHTFTISDNGIEIEESASGSKSSYDTEASQ